MFLSDFGDLSQRCRDWCGGGLHDFLAADDVKALAWPDDVVEQWLYDFAAHGPFLADYGDLNLSTIRWHDENVDVDEFLTMPTGPSDADLIEYFAEDPNTGLKCGVLKASLSTGKPTARGCVDHS